MQTFGNCLKQLRIEKSLTQKDLMTHINLLGEEFLGIDTVAISRWERGITEPHVIKSIKILRSLTNNLLPYLLSLPTKDETNLFEEIAVTRFYSPESTLTTATYSKRLQSKNIKLMLLFQERHDEYLIQLTNFFNSIGLKNKSLLDIDLYQHQIDKKIFGRKLVDRETNSILGHTLSIFFDRNEIREYYKNPSLELPINKAKGYKKNKPMALCTISRYADSEGSYWVINILVPLLLAYYGNIHDVYFYVFDKWSVDYMESLGAEKVAYDTPDDKGAIKVGSQHFKFGLFRIDSSHWLSRPEIRFLLQNLVQNNLELLVNPHGTTIDKSLANEIFI